MQYSDISRQKGKQLYCADGYRLKVIIACIMMCLCAMAVDILTSAVFMFAFPSVINSEQGAVLINAIIAAIMAILLACGVFNYSPVGTYDMTFTFDNGTAIHMELFGNDAKETVDHFIKLCEDGYFDGLTVQEFSNKLLYLGDKNADNEKGIKGEFSANGYSNKIPMTKGTVCLARGEGYDSGYGQFFILTKNNSKLNGEYAAFGRITDMDVVKDLIKACEFDDDGKIISSPKIVSTSGHDPSTHSHEGHNH